MGPTRQSKLPNQTPFQILGPQKFPKTQITVPPNKRNMRGNLIPLSLVPNAKLKTPIKENSVE